jgi:hypothetical protein
VRLELLLGDQLGVGADEGISQPRLLTEFPNRAEGVGHRIVLEAARGANRYFLYRG